MANRYWVGGAGTWSTSATTNWSATSGGAGGASVPTAADSVFFNQAGTYTVTCTGALACLDITVSAGVVTFATGTAPTFSINGSMSLIAGTVWSSTGAITFAATTTGNTVTTNGISFAGTIVFNGAGGEWTLGSALTTTGNLTITQGSFLSANYAISVSTLSSNNANVRLINLGSSTVTVSTNVTFTTTTNLTFIAGTSTIICNNFTTTFNGGGLVYYSVSFTGTVSGGTTLVTVSGQNTFSNLSISGRTSTGISNIAFTADQTINSTLTLTTGTGGNYRLFLRSDTIGIPRTLSVNSMSSSLTDIDFRDITITGAAVPVSGTRLGDCAGNTGIIFPAPKTVYYRTPGTGNWVDSTAWSSTLGGTPSTANFPLAQDTAVIPASLYPPTASTISISTPFNIGTIDTSLRTTNTVTISISVAPAIYGSWINGTGTTVSGAITLTFCGRTSQYITCAGKAFAQTIIIDSPGGTVQLNDAFSSTRAGSGAFTLNSGTFDASGYNFTLSGSTSTFISSGSNTRTIAIGSGTWSINGSAWDITVSTNLTVTGTGTISMTGGGNKSFIGGGIQTYPIINQGGSGTLTISGNNKFIGITNTVIGVVLFTGGSTNEFNTFNLSGTSGNRLGISTTNGLKFILKKPTSWNVGLHSIDVSNNVGLSFTGTDPDYLSISYTDGRVTTASKIYLGSTNILSLKYGSTSVSAVYLGSTKVF